MAQIYCFRKNDATAGCKDFQIKMCKHVLMKLQFYKKYLAPYLFFMLYIIIQLCKYYTSIDSPLYATNYFSKNSIPKTCAFDWSNPKLIKIRLARFGESLTVHQKFSCNLSKPTQRFRFHFLFNSLTSTNQVS